MPFLWRQFASAFVGIVRQDAFDHHVGRLGDRFGDCGDDDRLMAQL